MLDAMIAPPALDATFLEGELVAVLRRREAGCDVAHDVGHLRRVLRTARVIAREEGGTDPLVLTAAALLHDFVALPKNHPERHLASRMSGREAVPVLRELGFPEDGLADVVHAIEAHSYSARIPPLTPVARAIQDADRLDALGAVGVARCFAVSGAIGRPLFDPEDPLARNRTANDRQWGLDHFLVKLLRLPDTMTTDTGRRIAVERAEYLRSFIERLSDEVTEEPVLPAAAPAFR